MRLSKDAYPNSISVMTGISLIHGILFMAYQKTGKPCSKERRGYWRMVNLPCLKCNQKESNRDGFCDDCITAILLFEKSMIQLHKLLQFEELWYGKTKNIEKAAWGSP